VELVWLEHGRRGKVAALFECNWPPVCRIWAKINPEVAQSSEVQAMLKCVEGIYRDGKVELLEKPEDVQEAQVIVAFLPQRLFEFEADFEEPQTIEGLAAEQRRFLASIQEPLEDVALPSDE
jgi:hypothetical protein